MKKNRMMRVASALLVAVLLTTCAISGTFAKYTTSADAEDTARVAKWGVNVTAAGDEAFATTYNDAAPGTQVVSRLTLAGAEGGEASNVVAPGTNGTLGGITVSGKPEVVVDIEVTANLTLTGWTVDSAEYCPLEFTIGATTYKIGTGTAPAGYTYVADIAALETAVETAITALAATNVAANTDLARSISIDWAWAFEGNSDVNDTKLGNLTTLPTVEFECSVTVTQVD